MRGMVTMAVVWLACVAFGQGPVFLAGSCQIPAPAFAALAERAQALNIPIARFVPEAGKLEIIGATDETELLAKNAFLYLDGNFFLLGIREGTWMTFLRGTPEKAELVLLGTGTPPTLSSFSILEALGLLPSGVTVELSQKEVPLKLPAPPREIRLDPILWTLVGHPDWFAFASNQGLKRLGIRVQVVVELQGTLSQTFAPYIRSSTGALAELLIPIPLLPELGKDPAVKLVRPPHIPVPLGG